MGYKILFLVGLLFTLIGQVLLAQGNEFVYALEPIDFAHWFLLVGAVLLIPQVISFPWKAFNFIGIPLAFIGIICIIGMCVLDFIWWSFPTEELRSEFTKHISNVPAIWKPFISIGPSSKIFNLGLLLISFNYFKNSKRAIGILIIASLILMNVIPVPFRLVTGYTLTLIAFSVILLNKKNQFD